MLHTSKSVELNRFKIYLWAIFLINSKCTMEFFSLRGVFLCICVPIFALHQHAVSITTKSQTQIDAFIVFLQRKWSTVWLRWKKSLYHAPSIWKLKGECHGLFHRDSGGTIKAVNIPLVLLVYFEGPTKIVLLKFIRSIPNVCKSWIPIQFEGSLAGSTLFLFAPRRHCRDIFFPLFSVPRSSLVPLLSRSFLSSLRSSSRSSCVPFWHSSHGTVCFIDTIAG